MSSIRQVLWVSEKNIFQLLGGIVCGFLFIWSVILFKMEIYLLFFVWIICYLWMGYWNLPLLLYLISFSLKLMQMGTLIFYIYIITTIRFSWWLSFIGKQWAFLTLFPNFEVKPALRRMTIAVLAWRFHCNFCVFASRVSFLQTANM